MLPLLDALGNFPARFFLISVGNGKKNYKEYSYQKARADENLGEALNILQNISFRILNTVKTDLP